MKQNLMNRKSSWWKLVAVVMLLLTVTVSTVGSADTYNFIFPNGKKKSKKVATPKPPVQDATEDSDEEETEEESPSATAPAPSQPATTQSNQQIIHPQAPVPIVINNNITNAPAPAVAVPAAPVQQADVSPFPPAANQTMSSSATYTNYTPSADKLKFRIGASALYMADWDAKHVGNDNSQGGLFTLGFDASHGIGINTLFGVRGTKGQSTDLDYLAMELEMRPFMDKSKSWQVAELGILAGLSLRRQQRYGYSWTSSSYNYDTNEWEDSKSDPSIRSATAVALYVGARFNLNFNENVGLTAAVRGNGDHAFGEAGMAFKF